MLKLAREKEVKRQTLSELVDLSLFTTSTSSSGEASTFVPSRCLLLGWEEAAAAANKPQSSSSISGIGRPAHAPTSPPLLPPTTTVLPFSPRWRQPLLRLPGAARCRLPYQPHQERVGRGARRWRNWAKFGSPDLFLLLQLVGSGILCFPPFFVTGKQEKNYSEKMSPYDGAPEEFDQTIFSVRSDRSIGPVENFALNLVKDVQNYSAVHSGSLSSHVHSATSTSNMMSVAASFYKATLAVRTGISVPFNNLAIIYKQQFINLKYSRVEIDEVRFEWAE
ncbi:hypothetical protein ZIOFF_035607 [Zingiber officinale]|uniref:Uncharacterized protein n=1 Tax=Zingiber officinale TaxID=94328 RepID=A0A8J5GCS4_ZINOF|nr:hypothetical protein ZIOFF_035607 [Zingiber officinale]